MQVGTQFPLWEAASLGFGFVHQHEGEACLHQQAPGQVAIDRNIKCWLGTQAEETSLLFFTLVNYNITLPTSHKA